MAQGDDHFQFFELGMKDNKTGKFSLNNEKKTVSEIKNLKDDGGKFAALPQKVRLLIRNCWRPLPVKKEVTIDFE